MTENIKVDNVKIVNGPSVTLLAKDIEGLTVPELSEIADAMFDVYYKKIGEIRFRRLNND